MNCRTGVSSGAVVFLCFSGVVCRFSSVAGWLFDAAWRFSAQKHRYQNISSTSFYKSWVFKIIFREISRNSKKSCFLKDENM
jgi:hypothetical protein